MRHDLTPSLHPTRFYWLDWARFLAAFWVLLVHARGFNWVAYGDLQHGSQGILAAAFFAGTRLGHEAVILFFVLSGFLVGGKLLERSLTGSFDIRSYSIDRISRIYVPLAPLIIFTVVLGFIREQRVEPIVILGNLIGVQGVFVDTLGGNGPLWSLAYEIWFYVMAGALAVVLSGKRHRALGVLIFLLSLLIFLKLDPVLLMVWWLAAAGYFLRGHSKLLFWPGLGMALAGGVCMQLTSASDSLIMSVPPNDFFSYNLFVLTFGVGTILITASICDWKPISQATQIFEACGLKFAAFSYTLYLSHYPILALWNYFEPYKYDTLNFQSVGMLLARIAVCIFIAIILFIFFESRTLLARRWLNARWQTSPPKENAVGAFQRSES